MLLEKIYRRLLREAEELSGEELSAKILRRVEKAYNENMALVDLRIGPDRQIFILYKPSEIYDSLFEFLDDLDGGHSLTSPGVFNLAARTHHPVDDARGNAEALLHMKLELKLKIEEISRDFLSHVKANFQRSVVGVVDIASPSTVSTGKCLSASVVQFSAADEGYGPMLYDIAMSMAPNGKIMSDRSSVTNLAAQYYKNLSDRPDITAEPLVRKTRENADEPNACKTWKEKFPEREFLDYAYSRSSDFDATSLLNNHEDTLQAIKDMFAEFGMGPKDLEASINDGFRAAASKFFSKKYSAVPSPQIISVFDR